MFTNGVSIILTGSNDDYKGMAIAWVCQIEKEHIMVSVPKGAKATELLLARKAFSVNELGIGQEDLAREFGGKDCEYGLSRSQAIIQSTEHNLPIITNCCSSTVCHTLHFEEINEQVVITARIIGCQKHSDLTPLIFNKATYFK